MSVVVACRSRNAPAPRAEIEIRTALLGATAEVIESSVTTPLERQLGQIPQLADMRSHSNLGLSTIDLAFEPGTDGDASMMAVQQAINTALKMLPQTLPAPPVYHRMGKVVARYAFSSDTLPLGQLREVIEPIGERVSQVAGVGFVEICGASPREIHIDLDLAALAGAGMTALDVVDAIRKAPPFDDPKPLVVAERNGAPIRITDIAKISDGADKPACIATTERGRVVEMIVSGQSGMESADVRERVEAVMPQLRATMPSSVTVDSIGVMRVLSIALHATSIDQVRAATTAAKHVLIEQRANIIRLGIDADDASVASIRALLDRVPDVSVVEPDATLELTGADRDELTTFAKTIEAKLGSTISIGLDREITTRVDVDRDRLARLAVEPYAFDSTLATLGGVYATTVFTQLTRIPVIVRIASEPASLDAIYVRSVHGELVPLSTVAKLTTALGGERWHVGQFPMVGFRVHAATVPDLAELHAPPQIHVRLVPD